MSNTYNPLKEPEYNPNGKCHYHGFHYQPQQNLFYCNGCGFSLRSVFYGLHKHLINNDIKETQYWNAEYKVGEYKVINLEFQI